MMSSAQTVLFHPSRIARNRISDLVAPRDDLQNSKSVGCNVPDSRMVLVNGAVSDGKSHSEYSTKSCGAETYRVLRVSEMSVWEKYTKILDPRTSRWVPSPTC